MKNTIEHIINMCRNYNSGKIKNEELNEFFESLNISKRICTYKKGMIVGMAMRDLENLEIVLGNEEDTSANIESIYVKRFIVSYIEFDEGSYIINDDDIEDMYNSGLIDFILDRCERDFDVIKRMFENSIKFKYINLLSSMVGSVTSEENSENIEKISKIFSDKSMVEKVSEIMQYNDPAVKTLKEEIYKPIQNKIEKKK